MHGQKRIIALALMAGIFLWIADATIDYLIFYEAGFWDILLLDIPSQELYTRSVGPVLILLFGGVTARIVQKADQARAALGDSERRIRSTLDSMSDAIHVVDADLRIVLINRSFNEWLAQLGLHRVEPGSKVLEAFPFLSEKICGEYREVLESGQVMTTEGVTTISERPIYTVTRKIPIREGGEVVRVLTVVRDRTEQVLAERALRESEEKFRNLAEQSPNMIFINDNGRIAYANHKCVEVTGYSREEFYSKDFDFRVLIAPESIPAVVRSFKRHMTGEEVEPYNYRLLTKERRKIDAIITTRLISYEGRGAILGIVTDITSVKDAERKLLFYQSRLRALASRLELAEERERRLLAESLHDGVSQTLALTRIKLGQLRCKTPPSPVEALDQIDELLEQAIAQARSLLSELSSPILYELGLVAALTNLATNIERQTGVTILIDVGRSVESFDNETQFTLFKCLRELLRNVVRHSSANQARVHSTIENNLLRLTVTDDGEGFDATSLDGPVAEGFGLFSIRERMAILNGRMDVESNRGTGTIVRLSVPLKPAQPNFN